MPTLHVIILNYNRGDLLRTCLASLQHAAQAHPRHPYRMWVIDNASTDDSVAIIEREFPEIDLIKSPVNGGFAHGNNLVLRRLMTTPSLLAIDDYVMLLNNDTEITPDALELLIHFMETNPTVGAVGPKVLLPDGSLDLACRRSFPTPEVAFYRMSGLAKLFPHSRRFARYNLSFLPVDQQSDVDALVGAALLLRANVLREIGLLDEAFFMYGEDLDWCYRIKAYGWRIVYEPRAVVHHHKRATSARHAALTIHAFYDAMRIFHRKHYARDTLAPLNWLIEYGIMAKEAWALLRNRLHTPLWQRVG
ncbi:MAG: glycosyltransferase family 2 protein [Herpetosiphonaceae bacterium]|nr:glycosyltransferase family 2 protein [Herpetosiphonaceae bacterium]